MNSVVRARETKFSFVFSIALFVASCAAPQYDSAADKSIGELQRKIHVQIDNWISGVTKLNYAKNTKFYDDVDADLKSLEIRMESTPDPSTANLPIVFSNLSNQITSIRSLHKEQGSLSEFYLRAEQQLLDAQFATLLTYELSFKTVGGGATQSTATAKNPTTPTPAQ